MRLILSSFLILIGLFCATLATAQNPFAPVVRVNDRVITQFELTQRLRMMRALRTPGASEELALDLLIEDRLRQDELARTGITLTDEQIREGMEEFAGRANMTADQFMAALRQEGVEPETFRDFVSVGLAWRNYVALRFGPRAQVTEEEIDRRIALAGNRGGLRVLLSEIILPNTPEFAARTQANLRQIQQITTIGGFSNAASQFSVGPSRERGGRLDWLPLSNLPPQLRQLILSLQPGEISEPIPVQNALIIFQLRAVEETEAEDAGVSAMDYAMFFIPGGRTDATLAEAASIRGQADTCDDLYGLAKNLPEDRLQREIQTPDQIPQDIAIELARLDANESSVALTRGNNLMLLMLCGRTPDLGQDIDREAIRRALVNERVAALADGFLADLRADAVIVRQ
ncbi:peptidylprolyl isomerase [Pseudaestuariivita rosea]|uniref:peptidylprolyl isomerase n=1 Tax=Pseudaestuariivita rosea TaxID=2763263 RepID=UPI001ABA86D1|nr:peptidylprolyl isomerase [Pseudaestuariivita rosea]